MPDPPRQASGEKEAQAAIERFLEASRQPAVLEPGEEPFPMQPDSFLLAWRGARLMLEIWDKRRNLARRITRVESEKPGRLELAITQFPNREGRLWLVDLAGSRQAVVERRSARLVLRELFRRSLLRQFTGWKIDELSTEANLEASLSPAYSRALLKRGTAAWAALASPARAAGGALTEGLIWLDYLRRRESRVIVEGLALFLPAGHERTTCLRLRFLDSSAAQYCVYAYTEDGWEERLDLGDFGNVETKLDDCAALAPERPTHLDAWIGRIAAVPDVERIPRNDGSLSLRVRGFEFARATTRELVYGIETRRAAREADLGEIERIARELARLRSPEAADRENPLYRAQPELWLESQVRRHIEQIDASLLPSPVYGQVPAMAGGERGVIDLLAVDHAGRLAVLELKAAEDMRLPMQALDYWIRVKWHLDRGEFSSRGYFPGIALRPDPPRLLLIAPALDFHPSTEVVLRYVSPAVEVERVGLGVEWRIRPHVMFRMRGAERPV